MSFIKALQKGHLKKVHLADDVVVNDASLKDGLLTVQNLKELYLKIKKPKVIKIK